MFISGVQPMCYLVSSEQTWVHARRVTQFSFCPCMETCWEGVFVRQEDEKLPLSSQ